MLRVVFTLTYQGLHFSKDLWPKLSSVCALLDLSYNYVCVMSRKCFICGSRSLEPFLNFTTSFWLEEGLLFLCQYSCTSPLTASINFISGRGNLPVKAHISVWQPVSRLSYLMEYFRRVFTLHLIILDVSLSKRCCLVILLTIDSDKTRRATLRSLEHVFEPIFWKASTRFLTI